MASLLDLPIPPRPDYFGPDGAPPGVELRLDAYNTLDDGLPWTPTRPEIKRRMAVVHTNGADVEATVASSENYGRNTRTEKGRDTTKPHYLVGDRPAKVLRSDLRAIANSTGSDIERQYGERDASFWTLAIETADMGKLAALKAGYAWAADCGPFLTRPGDQPDDAEIVARILAYESMVPGHEFPLAVPSVWNGTGVVAHVWPWPYPYFTTVPGKTCPGATKIRQLRDEILPRAQQIAAAWSAPITDPEEDDDMPGPEYILKPPPGSPASWPFLYARGASVRPATGKDVSWANGNGVPVEEDLTSDGPVRYRNLHVAAMGREPGQ